MHARHPCLTPLGLLVCWASQPSLLLVLDYVGHCIHGPPCHAGQDDALQEDQLQQPLVVDPKEFENADEDPDLQALVAKLQRSEGQTVGRPPANPYKLDIVTEVLTQSCPSCTVTGLAGIRTAASACRSCHAAYSAAVCPAAWLPRSSS